MGCWQWFWQAEIHRHTGGLESHIFLQDKRVQIHRHTGGLEKTVAI